MPGQFISTQAIRHCNYQLSFCVNVANNADYRHTVNAALNGMPPPFYSFQSTNYPGNWISPIAGNKIMFCPGGSLCNNPRLPPDDGTWLLTPGVPTAPSNFSFTSASRNPAYANFYVSASMTCIGAMVTSSPAAARSYRPFPPPPPSRSVHFSRFSPACAGKSTVNSNLCAYTSPAGDAVQNASVTGLAQTMIVTPLPLVVGSMTPATPYYLSVFSARTGALQWSFAPTAAGGACPVTPTPAIGSNGAVYVGSGTGMNAILTGGALYWNYATGGPVCSSAALAGAMVFFGSSDSYVYALTANTAILAWRYQTGGAVHSSPALSASTGTSGTLFVGSSDGKIYGIDVLAGSLTWSFNAAAGAVWSSPAFVAPPCGGAAQVWVGAGDRPCSRNYTWQV